MFLAPHAGFFDLAGKSKRLASGEKPNPFIDPAGYRSFIEESEKAFETRLDQEIAYMNSHQKIRDGR